MSTWALMLVGTKNRSCNCNQANMNEYEERRKNGARWEERKRHGLSNKRIERKNGSTWNLAEFSDSDNDNNEAVPFTCSTDYE